MEVSIDEQCSRILATRGPTASDLRLVSAVIKTITDLERIGDEAEKIALLASRLAGVERPSTNYREFRNLARHVKAMVRGTLDAFARLDAKEALRVVRMDDAVDEEYESIVRQGVTFMMEDPRTISRVMDASWIARSLERIGDHCKNICEYVMFMVYGKDIRYTTLESIEAQFATDSSRQDQNS
jgi:phosphate transport system protein